MNCLTLTLKMRWMKKQRRRCFYAMVILIAIAGGLLFLYINVRSEVKVNLSYAFLHIYTNIIILNKKYEFRNTIDYNTVKNFINVYRDEKEENKFKKEIKYYKYYKRYRKFFYIKNIQIFPELIFDKSSITVEFLIVNRLLKKSILSRI